VAALRQKHGDADALRRAPEEKRRKIRGDKLFLKLFMPKKSRADMVSAYSYLREVDDLVDAEPPKREEYFRKKGLLLRAISGEKIPDRGSARFAELALRHGFRREWLDSFFASMEKDLSGTGFATRAQLDEYIKGVSDAPAEMISSICGLSGAQREAVKALSRSIEYLNLLRDLGEDLDSGRCYVPADELARFGLRDATRESARKNPEGFRKLVSDQLARYEKTADRAQELLESMPTPYRRTLNAMSSIYRWSARKIARDPWLVYEADRKNFRPSGARVIAYYAKSALESRRRHKNASPAEAFPAERLE
jgi:phytoene synthase